MASFWAVKKQISYFLIALIIVLGAGYLFWKSATQPTCFDNKQNQNEKGIDCGGPCEKECLGNVEELIVLWSKFFETSPGKYEAVSLIKNPNIFLAIPSIKYQLRLYDKNNISITARDGQTFITPGDTFPVFEIGVDTGSRVPAKVFIEFEKNPGWQRMEKEKLSLVVAKKEFFNTSPFPRLSITLENKSISAADNIEVAAVLYDRDKNAQGVSITEVDTIPGQNFQEVVFTWIKPFIEEPDSIEIFFRQSLTN